MSVSSVCLLPIFAVLGIEAVPPEACFANFRWDDCGKAPVPVMYYWKPGSRCEVGLWRGCVPSLNMFQDEYECITTCIFSARAMPEDYHSFNENEIEGATDGPSTDMPGNFTVFDNSTSVSNITVGNNTINVNGTTNGTASFNTTMPTNKTSRF